VIHRFCETFRDGDDAETRLRTSFADVVAQRQSELAGRAFEIEPDEAVRDLMPLAQNYLKSEVFKRVAAANRLNGESNNPKSEIQNPKSSQGLWSELRFRLRRPAGILTGTIDKLLITPSVGGEGFDVEVIDFKTNRFRTPSHQRAKQPQTTAAAATLLPVSKPVEITRAAMTSQPAQALFDFDTVVEESPANVVTTADPPSSQPGPSITEQAENVARDYQLQMQSYALALHELLEVRTGSGSDRVIDSPLKQGLRINTLRATLHFIDPNVEISLPAALLDQEVCARAVDDAMLSISTLDSTLDADLFPPLAATHCRICNFLELCPAGRDWLKQR